MKFSTSSNNWLVILIKYRLYQISESFLFLFYFYKTRKLNYYYCKFSSFPFFQPFFAQQYVLVYTLQGHLMIKRIVFCMRNYWRKIYLEYGTNNLDFLLNNI